MNNRNSFNFYQLHVNLDGKEILGAYEFTVKVDHTITVRCRHYAGDGVSSFEPLALGLNAELQIGTRFGEFYGAVELASWHTERDGTGLEYLKYVFEIKDRIYYREIA